MTIKGIQASALSAAAIRRTFTIVGVVTLALTSGATHAQKRSAHVEAVGGAWHSTEQFEGHPRATLIVREDGALLTGSLTLRGMTRGADDRATVTVALREAKWDGSILAFATILPDNEGKAAWSLTLAAPGKGTLHATTADGKPIEDGPTWAMISGQRFP